MGGEFLPWKLLDKSTFCYERNTSIEHWCEPLDVYCAEAWFCVEVFVGQNDAFSCSGLAGRCSGAAAGGGAGLVLGHGVARSGGRGGAHMTSSAILCLWNMDFLFA